MKMLAAVDLSPASSRVVSACRRLAGPCGADVILLHVLPRDPDQPDDDLGSEISDTQLAAERPAIRAALNAHAEALGGDGISVRVLVARGSTVELVLRQVGETDAQMLVIGSHGHGSLYDIVVGSTSLGILRAAAVPVLVVPARVD
jgi:nucleotide-binding universal stress UspA family protein